MFKALKIILLTAFFAVLIAAFKILHQENAHIRASLEEMGNGFINTAQQLLNEGNSDFDASVTDIQNGTTKFLKEFAD